METDPTVRPGTPGRHRVHAGNDVSVPKVVVDVRPSPIPIHSHCLQVKGKAVVRRHYCLIEARSDYAAYPLQPANGFKPGSFVNDAVTIVPSRCQSTTPLYHE